MRYNHRPCRMRTGWSSVWRPIVVSRPPEGCSWGAKRRTSSTRVCAGESVSKLRSSWFGWDCLLLFKLPIEPFSHELALQSLTVRWPRDLTVLLHSGSVQLHKLLIKTIKKPALQLPCGPTFSGNKLIYVHYLWHLTSYLKAICWIAIQNFCHVEHKMTLCIFHLVSLVCHAENCGHIAGWEAGCHLRDYISLHLYPEICQTYVDKLTGSSTVPRRAWACISSCLHFMVVIFFLPSCFFHL